MECIDVCNKWTEKKLIVSVRYLIQKVLNLLQQTYLSPTKPSQSFLTKVPISSVISKKRCSKKKRDRRPGLDISDKSLRDVFYNVS